ncbi:hypothetical protein VHA01S_058_00160 [Vibrio halioticoli NBRC 102217]|uniref:Lipoprotein n=1 Tax=Vibrio halioticoli NBRC 102217 TaxID=1219072 RepID=V5FQA4_9VIBR|nr:DUF6279 family lipoprotein [Vibrio halioticoli]GAD90862.1 hypothetical protein VHA01S_058_00160 [Vibrio halioticoli NBRC 102217]
MRMIRLQLDGFLALKRWRLKSIILGALLLTLTACTAKMVYRNLDWVVLEYVEDYVTLTGIQEEILDQRLQQLALWHKTEELPHYQAQLQTLYDAELSAVDMAFLQQQQEVFRAHIRRLSNKATPDVYLLSRSLSKGQIDEFIENLTLKHEMFTKKFASKSDQQAKRYYQERIEKNLHRWLGSVSDEQQVIVETWVNNIERSHKEWALYRITMRDRIHTMFARRDDPFFYQKELTFLVNEPEQVYPELLTLQLERNRQLANQSIVSILATVSDAQKRHFREEIQEWMELVKELQIE